VLADVRDRDEVITSALTEIEAHRGIVRHNPEHLPWARRLLATWDTVPIDGDVVHLARHLEPPALRSLDAIHLATALLAEVDAVATFDRRLAVAAAGYGLDVVAPRS
jgi:predicted nucleic acid-binding protein